ncbi:MAG: penicillin acylase family protein, partial [Myxococcales bacterium]|nr:penicillin acylase family protein [Myxococcales bacterium]
MGWLDTIKLGKRTTIRRNRLGVPIIHAPNLDGCLRALGYMHVIDRGVQMEISRLLGAGRLSENLAETPEVITLDTTVRRLGLYREPKADLDLIKPLTLRYLTAYVEGVNEAWQKRKRPLLFTALRYRVASWTLSDVVRILRFTAYFGFASTQASMERVTFELLKTDLSDESLSELLALAVAGVDRDGLREVSVESEHGTEPLRSHLAAVLAGSNAWAIGPSRTGTVHPILANDPHMDVARLPALWYEAELHADDHDVVGATSPGLPAVLFGRNRHLGWGMTYCPGDAVDFFIEDCRDGMRRAGDTYRPFDVREEEVRTRCGEVRRFAVYSSEEHGVLEGNPYRPGKYLSVRWTGAPGRFASSFDSVTELMRSTSVGEARECLKGFHYPSITWVLADAAGNIGRQVTGLFPLRPEGASGKVPLPGWEASNNWIRLRGPDELPGVENPPGGFVVAANEDQNEPGMAPFSTFPMASYRHNRIANRLKRSKDWSVSETQTLQYDLVSDQAARFVPLFLPHIEDQFIHAELSRWHYDFTPNSYPAVVFDAIYRALLMRVFGDGGLTRERLAYLLDETPFLVNMVGRLDAILTNPDSVWFEGRDRDELIREAVREGCGSKLERNWGRRQPVTHRNLVLGGKLPSWTGAD